ncbi:MAG: hypothetical protein FWF60_03360 [Oscillospiraceae bacterium]|nr:hypothetical protein [Oscillospiraceae bacterium]
MLESIRQSISEYPLLYIFILAALALCVFLWAVAMRAARRRRVEKDALIAALDYEKALRAQFKTVTRQMLADTHPERLVEGVCCSIQMDLESQPDMQAAYDALPEPRRLVYALGYVIQDGRGALSGFFRKNGQPLTAAALEAVQRLVGGECAAVFGSEYDAFDEANEAVSLVRGDIAAADARWEALSRAAGEGLYAGAKGYILENSQFFVV